MKLRELLATVERHFAIAPSSSLARVKGLTIIPMLANQEIYLLASGTQWMVESFKECDRIRCRCSSDFSQAAQRLRG